MKKSLIALAALGSFAGAAAAQSSVTLYGLIDVGYGQTNGGYYETGKHVKDTNKFQQIGNENSTSRWGLKGTEDLGGGLKANFNLEQGINPENGAEKKSGFDRAAWVGLSGDFGQVRAGRITVLSNQVLGQYDLSGAPNTTSAYGNAGLSPIAPLIGKSTSHKNDDGTTVLDNGRPTASRRSSQLQYISPAFDGLSVQGSYETRYDDDVAGSDADGNSLARNVWALGTNYVWGGLSVGAAYESKPLSAAGVSGMWGIGTKYDFGTFVVSANYFDNHRDIDGKGYGLGVAVPVGAFTVGAQVARNYKAYTLDASRKSIKPVTGELFTKYAFSKRTSAYANYGRLDSDAEAFQAAQSKNSWGIGLIHQF